MANGTVCRTGGTKRILHFTGGVQRKRGINAGMFDKGSMLGGILYVKTKMPYSRGTINGGSGGG